MMRKAAIVFFVLLMGWGNIVLAEIPKVREYFNRASLQFISGNLEGAIKNLDLALKLEPNYPAARKLKNLILREKTVRQIKSEGVPKSSLIQNTQKISLEALDKGRLEMIGLEKAKQVAAQRYWLFTFTYFLGFITLGVFLSYLAVMINRIITGGLPSRDKEKKCFKCGKKITGNEEVCPYCGAYVGFKTWQTISKEQNSWYAKLGWRKNPFCLDIFPELMTGHKKKIKEILEKINAKSGHVLVTGPFGIGKTTLLRWLSFCLPKTQFHTVYISRPPQQFDQLIRYIVSCMGGNVKELEPQGIYQIDALRRKLGKDLILLLDEAHEFTEEIERPLRTLGDLDRVVLVMAGLPETTDKLKTEIQPLYERLVLKVGLDSLTMEEMEAMIKVRIENAGGSGLHPFTTNAIKKIYDLSKGVPRTVFKICDAAVTRAMNMGEDKIGTELLDDLPVLAP